MKPQLKIRIFLLFVGLLFPCIVFSQIDPGWGSLDDKNGAAQALRSEVPLSSFSFEQRGFSTPSDAQPSLFLARTASTGMADQVTPEIEALADGLKNDPVKIFNHVFNHIEYDHYFGSKKGATMTLLTGRGNSFDTAALLVALLRSAGYTAEYRYGPAQFTFDELSNWCDFRLDSYSHLTEAEFRQQYDLVGINLPVEDLKKYTYVLNFNSRRGYPYTDVGDLGFGANYYQIPHVWVRVTVDSQTWEVDPSFKLHTHYTREDIKSITGFNRNTFFNTIGGTIQGDSVTGISTTDLANLLTDYSTNIRNWIRSNNPAIQTVAFTGGPRINPVSFNSFNETYQILYASRPWLSVTTWPSTIPSEFMSKYEIEAGQLNNGVFSSSGFDTSIQTPWLNGQKLSLTFSGNTASLKLDDAAWETFTVSGSSVVLRIKAIHPYYSFVYNPSTGQFETTNQGRGDQEEFKTYQKSDSNAYTFVYGFGAPGKHLRKRQEQLDAYRRQGISDADERIKTEILNVMGLTWMMQTELSDFLIASQLDINRAYSHRFGRVSQEDNFFIDIGLQIQGLSSHSGIESDEKAFLALASFFGSAMEHGVMEQLQGAGVNGASTVKMVSLANDNNVKIFQANSANWSGGGGIKAQLDNYPAAVLDKVEDVVLNQGGVALIPEEGSQLLNDWTGYGYATIEQNFVDMGITGGLKGGYNTSGGVVDVLILEEWTASDPSYLWSGSAFIELGSWPATTPMFHAADPVEMATGAFVLDKTEMTLGSESGPRGLSFSRHYHSGNRYNKTGSMGFGWTHNHNIYISQSAGIRAGLGQTTSAHMSPYLSAITAAIDVYRDGTSTAKELTTVALIAKWAADQLRNNGVGVVMGNRTYQFVEMPDGTYEPPAGQKISLLKNGQGNYVMEERHGLIYTFDSTNDNRISTITDPSGNELSFNYSGNKLTQVTDTYGRSLEYSYEGTDKIQSVTDGERTVSFSYTDDILMTVTDVESKDYSFEYDSENRITVLRDPYNRIITENTYDNGSRVITQKSMGDSNRLWRFFYTGYCNIEQNPEGDEKTYIYDQKGRCTANIDELGNESARSYDGQDRIILTVNPELEVTRFSYNAGHDLTRMTDSLGYFVDYAYDPQLRLQTVTDKRGKSASYTYNSAHQILTATDPLGHTTTYQYYPEGLLHTVKDAESKVTTTTYDSFGTVNKLTLHDGASTTFTNNARGDILTSTDAEGRTTTNTWNKRRQLLTTEAPTIPGQPASIVTNTYDDAGNLASTEDANGNIASHTWNSIGKIVTSTEPAIAAGNNVITTTYDLRDWIQKTSNSLNHEMKREYDAAKRMIALIDPLNRRTENTYDAKGQLLEIKDPLNRINKSFWNDRGELFRTTDGENKDTDYEFDENGNRTKLTDRRGKEYTFVYDDANRLNSSSTPSGKTTRMIYFDNNLVKTVEEPSGQTTTHTYNDRNLVSSKSDPAGTISYGYDDSGLLETITEGSDTITRTFDERGKVKTYTNEDGDTLQYQYDGNGNLIQLTYPDGRKVYYTFNARNLLKTVTDWSGRVTTYSYDQLGRLIGIIRPNGTTAVIERDAGDQILSIGESANNKLFSLLKFDYDLAGQITSRFHAPIYNSTFPNPDFAGTYDDDNRLLTANAAAVTHDDDGNMTFGPITATSGNVSLTYNSRNQLTAADGVTYTYDAEGHRRTMTDANGTTRFTIDANANMSRLLVRHNPDGSRTFYVYGLGLLYEVDEAENTKTYHFDQVGSTITRTDDIGEVIGRAEYSPYGLSAVKEGDMDTPFLYNGQWGIQTDANGLLNMRARYYSPYLMRFLNADPLGFSGGQNWFAYADGNPISTLDPFGLWGWRNSLSMALDFIPVVGTVKGVAELAFGYDIIAGEEVNRAVAAAGVAASFIPGGKAATKMGTKAFSRGLKSADEAAEVATNLVKNGDGFVYKRTSRKSEVYFGQAKDELNLAARKRVHNGNTSLNGPHDFDIVGRAKSGLDLDILEETFIRNGGGTAREGSPLLNKNHVMNPDRYLSGVNMRLRELQKNVLRDTALLNGSVQSINRIK